MFSRSQHTPISTIRVTIAQSPHRLATNSTKSTCPFSWYMNETNFRLLIAVVTFTISTDCFQRVVLEAMFPGDKVYRNIETNSVRMCQDYCASDGDRCQAFAIGISTAGNGTCQLSAESATESGERRPKGTIYDPSFDIYNRKKHCLPMGHENAIPSAIGGERLLFIVLYWCAEFPNDYDCCCALQEPFQHPQHLRSTSIKRQPLSARWSAPTAQK